MRSGLSIAERFIFVRERQRERERARQPALGESRVYPATRAPRHCSHVTGARSTSARSRDWTLYYEAYTPWHESARVTWPFGTRASRAGCAHTHVHVGTSERGTTIRTHAHTLASFRCPSFSRSPCRVVPRGAPPVTGLFHGFSRPDVRAGARVRASTLRTACARVCAVVCHACAVLATSAG